MNGKSISYVISAFILALGLAVGGYFIAYGIMNFHNFNRYVQVKGLSEQTLKANEAVFSISFSANADDLKSLYQKIQQSQNAIIVFLKENGLKRDEISLGGTSINTNTNRDNKNTPLYSAYGTITVLTAKVDLIQRLNQLTGQLVEKGVVITSSQVSYRYTQLNDIKPSMLVNATANAKIAADTFAKNAHASLGSIRQASQGTFSISNANDSYGDSDIMKKVRVVVSAQYFLRN
ncbi:SIMPL domain-containing protein [Thiotrichales bacterium 19S3-7]|nr:SIMPL domain-containing protein [Thiotrichales bacterium 19S3-7]MCF6802648.1 SIMPL domain-containing protein [Thiotrichales bacterium 19S3-11]